MRGQIITLAMGGTDSRFARLLMHWQKMSSKTGRRVQIYIPADLVERWDRLPRYERSAEVAKALRAWWRPDELTPEVTPDEKLKRGVRTDKPRSGAE